MSILWGFAIRLIKRGLFEAPVPGAFLLFKAKKKALKGRGVGGKIL